MKLYAVFDYAKSKTKTFDFCKNNPETAVDIILMVIKLELRIKELEAKIGMNSQKSQRENIWFIC
jgi:hypothetical protein